MTLMVPITFDSGKTLAAAATAALVAGTVNGAAAATNSIGKQKSCGQCERDDPNDQGRRRKKNDDDDDDAFFCFDNET